MSRTSFNNFLLRYMDYHEISIVDMAIKLDVSYSALCGWIYAFAKPSKTSQKVLKNYFGDDLKNVVFDHKHFKRVTKITRPDGSCAFYETDLKAREVEQIPYNAFQGFKNTEIPISSGKGKGYLIDTEYKEV